MPLSLKDRITILHMLAAQRNLSPKHRTRLLDAAELLLKAFDAKDEAEATQLEAFAEFVLAGGAEAEK